MEAAYFEARTEDADFSDYMRINIDMFCMWLFHTARLVQARQNDQFQGTRERYVGGGVSTMTMGYDARILMDMMLDRYAKFIEVERDDLTDRGVYRFVYWLCRYSDLIEPTEAGWTFIRASADWVSPEDRGYRRALIEQRVQTLREEGVI